MPQSPVLKIADEVIEKVFSNGICEYITVKERCKFIYMVDQSAVDLTVIFSSTPGSLGHHFVDKLCEVDALNRFTTAEVVDVVLPAYRLMDCG